MLAVKKSKVIDEGRIEEFINKVAILSQINHRNVVKLLGCCLETKVPLLVYEFIPNGSLYQYLHDQNEELPFTWEMHLQISTEVAGALSYLHLAASLPIYHRDIKYANILLDKKYKAKIADFGTSRSISIDQTHVTTKGKNKEIMIVANLAKRCLNLNGKKRPSMREVAMVLEGIQASKKESNVQQNHQEVEYVRTKAIEPWDIVVRDNKNS
ncbi:hypothetical protein ACOSP7_004063 [Xanthoceras sorbifolium]